MDEAGHIFHVPEGVEVVLWNANTEACEKFVTKKETVFSTKVDWATFWERPVYVEEVKKKLLAQLGNYGLSHDIVDLPANDRGWTHMFVPSLEVVFDIRR